MDQSPESSTLRRGALLGAIVNAVMRAQRTGYECYQYWDGPHYIVDGTDGRRGAVALPEETVVGVMFDCHSPRSPYHAAHYDLDRFFEGATAFQRSLAEEGPLRYMIHLVNGEPRPCITSAFWEENGRLVGAEPWNEVVQEGGDILRIELIASREEALSEWQDSYQMSAEQVALARRIFERKLATPAAPAVLTESEARFLASSFEDPREFYRQLEKLRCGAPSAPGAPRWWESIDVVAEARKAWNSCREGFAAIGVVLPE
jgi:hypothetical protein